MEIKIKINLTEFGCIQGLGKRAEANQLEISCIFGKVCLEYDLFELTNFALKVFNGSLRDIKVLCGKHKYYECDLGL